MAVNLSLTKEQVQLLLPMLQQITDLDTRSDQMAVQTPTSARVGHPTANGSWNRYQWQFGSSGSSKPELWMSEPSLSGSGGEGSSVRPLPRIHSVICYRKKN